MSALNFSWFTWQKSSSNWLVQEVHLHKNLETSVQYLTIILSHRESQVEQALRLFPTSSNKN